MFKEIPQNGKRNRKTIYSTCRRKKKHLSGQILNSREEEKEGLHSLLESARVRLRNLRKKELSVGLNKSKEQTTRKKLFKRSTGRFKPRTSQFQVNTLMQQAI